MTCVSSIDIVIITIVHVICITIIHDSQCSRNFRMYVCMLLYSLLLYMNWALTPFLRPVWIRHVTLPAKQKKISEMLLFADDYKAKKSFFSYLTWSRRCQNLSNNKSAYTVVAR